MDWQFYWRKWHFGYDCYVDPDLNIMHKYLFIGPLQIKWYGGTPDGR